MEKKIGVKKGGVLAKIGGQAMQKPAMQALQKTTTKAITTLGLVGLFFMLIGSACLPPTNTVPEEVKSQIATEVLQAKLEMKQEFKKQQEEAKANYSEDSFVKFSLQYPASWSIIHEENVIKFRGNNGSFEIEKIVLTSDIKKVWPKLESGKWFNFDVFKVEEASDKAGTEILTKQVYVLPGTLQNSRTAITIIGTPNKFDQIFNSITDFDIN
jgi:hypothetical protein